MSAPRGFIPISPGMAEVGFVDGALVVRFMATDAYVPAAISTATAKAAGAIPSEYFSSLPGINPTFLADANASITPLADRSGAYYLPDGVTTANRTITLVNTGTAPAGAMLYNVRIVIKPQTHSVLIANDQGTIVTVAANVETVVCVFYFDGTRFLNDRCYYGNA